MIKNTTEPVYVFTITCDHYRCTTKFDEGDRWEETIKIPIESLGDIRGLEPHVIQQKAYDLVVERLRESEDWHVFTPNTSVDPRTHCCRCQALDYINGVATDYISELLRNKHFDVHVMTAFRQWFV